MNLQTTHCANTRHISTNIKMFEVKGWKLSAPLKTDTSVSKKRSNDNDNEQPTQQTRTKKRRRGGVNVTAENLAEAWQEHIEGRPTDTQEQDGVGRESKWKQKKPKRVVGEAGVQPASKKQKDSHGERQRDTSSKEKQVSIPYQPRDTQHVLDKDNGAALQSSTPSATVPRLTALQSKMSHKLASARFRHLNEQLYTTPSKDSLSLFTTNPKMFTDYHAGFAQQVEVWPENPVDSYVFDILERGKVRGPPAGGKGKHRNEIPGEVRLGDLEPLPRIRDRGFQCMIADLGCGTAKLASNLQPHMKKLNLKVHSFDLHAPSPFVTAADIANLPLADGSIDVAIACLALMGTNWIDFVEEAWRILRWKGEFWVAEIKSRFSRSTAPSTGSAHSISKRQQKKQGLVGKAAVKKDRTKQDKDDQEQLEMEVDGVTPEAGGKGETDVGQFVKVLERRGFVLQGTPDLSNKMFVKMRFVKATAPARGKHTMVKDGAAKGKKFVDKPDEDDFDEASVLKPCVYKLR